MEGAGAKQRDKDRHMHLHAALNGKQYCVSWFERTNDISLSALGWRQQDAKWCHVHLYISRNL